MIESIKKLGDSWSPVQSYLESSVRTFTANNAELNNSKTTNNIVGPSKFNQIAIGLLSMHICNFGASKRLLGEFVADV